MRAPSQRCLCVCGPFRVSVVPHGLLKPYILRLLSEKPMHGFEIMESIFSRSNGLWRPGPAAIYPTLSWLEDKGYIETVSSRPGRSEKSRKPYRLTAKGEDALKDFARFRKEWLDEVSNLKDIWG